MRLVAWVLTIFLLPIIVPLAIYIGLTYRWQDTVPKEEDYEDI